MVVWSALRCTGIKILNGKASNVEVLANVLQKRTHKTMVIQPSRWQWHKFKDLFHYYFMVGAIPVAAILFYANVFIGPATLAPIPENYEPKHWEYYKHPVTRFLARYVYPSPQEDYEKFLHFLYEEDEKRKMRKVNQQVLEKMKTRSDYQAFYYRPITSKYHVKSREVFESFESVQGNN